MRCAAAAVVVVLSCWPALAFEGVLHLDVTAEGKTSRGRVLLSEGGDMRADFMLPLAGKTVNTSLIVLGSNDDVLVHAVHDTKTFERRALPSTGAGDERFVVERQGEGDVAGRAVKQFRVVDTKSGDLLELAVDPAIDDDGKAARVWLAFLPQAGDIGGALAAAGARGTPVRIVWNRQHAGAVHITVVEVSAEKLEREAFDLPRGYREAALGAMLSGLEKGDGKALAGEAQRGLEKLLGK